MLVFSIFVIIVTKKLGLSGLGVAGMTSLTFIVDRFLKITNSKAYLRTRGYLR